MASFYRGGARNGRRLLGLRLRLGEIYYELGDPHMASQELPSAYLLGDTEIFAEEDPKYRRRRNTALEETTARVTATAPLRSGTDRATLRGGSPLFR